MYGSVGCGFSQKSDHSTEFVAETRKKEDLLVKPLDPSF